MARPHLSPRSAGLHDPRPPRTGRTRPPAHRLPSPRRNLSLRRSRFRRAHSPRLGSSCPRRRCRPRFALGRPRERGRRLCPWYRSSRRGSRPRWPVRSGSSRCPRRSPAARDARRRSTPAQLTRACRRGRRPFRTVAPTTVARTERSPRRTRRCRLPPSNPAHRPTAFPQAIRRRGGTDRIRCCHLPSIPRTSPRQCR